VGEKVNKKKNVEEALFDARSIKHSDWLQAPKQAFCLAAFVKAFSRR
jgi:hypothetical protein